MNERSEGQQVLSVLFGHLPLHAGLVSGRIAEHPVGALDEVGKTGLFGSFAVGFGGGAGQVTRSELFGNQRPPPRAPAACEEEQVGRRWPTIYTAKG